jgi:hypothetical protein
MKILYFSNVVFITGVIVRKCQSPGPVPFSQSLINSLMPLTWLIISPSNGCALLLATYLRLVAETGILAVVHS